MWYKNILTHRSSLPRLNQLQDKKKEIGYHVQKDGVNVFLDNNANEITRTYWPDVPASNHFHRCNYLNEVTTSYQNKLLIITSTLYCVEFTTKGLLYVRNVCGKDAHGYITKDSFEYIFVDYEDE